MRDGTREVDAPAARDAPEDPAEKRARIIALYQVRAEVAPSPLARRAYALWVWRLEREL